MNDKKTFYKFVIPSMIAFALSGVYAIVDGYFVGNAIGDAGLSAINIAYPIVAVQQAIGTGIGTCVFSWGALCREMFSESRFSMLAIRSHSSPTTVGRSLNVSWSFAMSLLFLWGSTWCKPTE